MKAVVWDLTLTANKTLKRYNNLYSKGKLLTKEIVQKTGGL